MQADSASCFLFLGLLKMSSPDNVREQTRLPPSSRNFSGVNLGLDESEAFCVFSFIKTSSTKIKLTYRLSDFDSAVAG
jgi:hypothetical protein